MGVRPSRTCRLPRGSSRDVHVGSGRYLANVLRHFCPAASEAVVLHEAAHGLVEQFTLLDEHDVLAEIARVVSEQLPVTDAVYYYYVSVEYVLPDLGAVYRLA